MTTSSPRPPSNSQKLFEVIRDNSGITFDQLVEKILADDSTTMSREFMRTMVLRFAKASLISNEEGRYQTLVPEYKAPPPTSAKKKARAEARHSSMMDELAKEEPPVAAESAGTGYHVPSPFEPHTLSDHVDELPEDHLDEFLNTLTLKEIFTLQQRIHEYAMRLLGTST